MHFSRTFQKYSFKNDSARTKNYSGARQTPPPPASLGLTVSEQSLKFRTFPPRDQSSGVKDRIVRKFLWIFPPGNIEGNLGGRRDKEYTSLGGGYYGYLEGGVAASGGCSTATRAQDP